MAKAKRAYGVDSEGVRIPSVTEILGQNLGWSKDGLINWAHRLGKEGRSLRERDEAAALGTAVHDIVSESLGGEPALMEASIRELAEPNAKRVVEQIVDIRWKVLHTELAMNSGKFAGTCDLIVQGENGSVGVVDIKTGKAVHEEVPCQLAAYAGLFELVRGNVPPVTWGAVLHCPFGAELKIVAYSQEKLLVAGQIFAALLAINALRKKL